MAEYRYLLIDDSYKPSIWFTNNPMVKSSKPICRNNGPHILQRSITFITLHYEMRIQAERASGHAGERIYPNLSIVASTLQWHSTCVIISVNLPTGPRRPEAVAPI